ncbi:hypothetical protein CYY_007129 [Polysphondylium violaceum]|uniref:Uncharacterized protein n=1 Tax=Polysphondylium violaceum TaxID=133409 RepID=A0A8J4PQW7_9MYCE|nr:hypothetical protein CYY_007129 [Polysphondylium violaceum]
MTQFSLKRLAVNPTETIYLNHPKLDAFLSLNKTKEFLANAAADIFSNDNPEYYTPGMELEVLSQGVVRLLINAPATGFKLIFNEKNSTSQGSDVYALEVTKDYVAFLSKNESGPANILATTKSIPALLEPGVDCYYWFSVDKKNKLLKYGKGDATQSLTLLTYSVKENFLKNLKYVGSSLDWSTITKRKIYELPVTIQLPPFVIGNEDITLEDIEAGVITSVGNLPKECQMLHSVVAGPKIILTDEIIVGIRGSLKNGKLKEILDKKGEQHADPKESYLRITLGMDMGYSPGVPFVLELWPGNGHYSPIHTHSDAYAIIKVLHNAIDCFFYPDLRKQDIKPYLKATFKKDQVTYLTPTLYRTHKLYNPTDDFTATLQCYRYASEDKVHYETFDFLNDKLEVDTFVPNTDLTYTQLKDVLKKEGYLTTPLKSKSEAA